MQKTVTWSRRHGTKSDLFILRRDEMIFKNEFNTLIKKVGVPIFEV